MRATEGVMCYGLVVLLLCSHAGDVAVNYDAKPSHAFYVLYYVAIMVRMCSDTVYMRQWRHVALRSDLRFMVCVHVCKMTCDIDKQLHSGCIAQVSFLSEEFTSSKKCFSSARLCGTYENGCMQSAIPTAETSE